MELVPPLFGRLTVFDGRLPHLVREIRGTQDPLKARVVLHGWFAWPTAFIAGALPEAQATPPLNAALDAIYERLETIGAGVVGTVVVRASFGATGGGAQGLEWLTNTLVARPGGRGGGEGEWEDPAEVCEAVLAAIAEGLVEASFPLAGEGTSVTVPFVFE
jgi:hypothetical protein